MYQDVAVINRTQNKAAFTAYSFLIRLTNIIFLCLLTSLTQAAHQVEIEHQIADYITAQQQEQLSFY